MNDIQIDLQAIREHLDVIEAKLKEARMMKAYSANTEETDYRNAGPNGNFDG